MNASLLPATWRHRVALGVVVLAAGACGTSVADPRCDALRDLRAAVRQVGRAEAAERASGAVETRARIDDVRRLIAQARSALARSGSGDANVRRLHEAANYLEFIVQEFDRSGAVDGTMAQFAARELERSAPGVPILPC